ncbi:MAG: DUF4124 domain-containing protein [Gammaproteobacteria bacterium]|nr:DUF4124 domain-containing protein [Gammaproteobacteria bacterium]
MKKYILLLSLVITPVNAGVYKWTDDDGNVHFGDRPANPDSATEIIIHSDNNNTGVTNSSGNKKEREYLLRKIDEEKLADAEKRKKRSAEEKKRKKRCNYFKSRYQSHIQSNRTYRTSPEGERYYLTDEERAARKKKLSKNVAKYCR